MVLYSHFIIKLLKTIFYICLTAHTFDASFFHYSSFSELFLPLSTAQLISCFMSFLFRCFHCPIFKFLLYTVRTLLLCSISSSRNCLFFHHFKIYPDWWMNFFLCMCFLLKAKTFLLLVIISAHVCCCITRIRIGQWLLHWFFY